MTAEEIEAAVAVPGPIDAGDLSQPLKLFGEDAIMDWPGAMEVIIRDRDAYMARALAAAAAGALQHRQQGSNDRGVALPPANGCPWGRGVEGHG